MLTIPSSRRRRAVAGLGIAVGLSGRRGPGADAPTHVACIGDSITYGYMASSPSASYPSVLQNLLGSKAQGEELRPQQRHDAGSTGDLPYQEPDGVHGHHHLRVGRRSDGPWSTSSSGSAPTIRSRTTGWSAPARAPSSSSRIAAPWSIASRRCRPTRSSTWLSRRAPSPTPTGSAERSSTIRSCRSSSRWRQPRGCRSSMSTRRPPPFRISSRTASTQTTTPGTRWSRR